MKPRTVILSLAILLGALPLQAQVTQAQHDSAIARIAVLEKMLGKEHLGKAAAELQAALVPANELPGGKYPYILSDYQLRTAGLAGLQTQITGLAARVSAIEAQAAGGQPVGTAVFDVIKARRVCIVDAGLPCDDDWNAQLQIRGNGLANIGLESNMAHIDPQDPEHTHSSQISNSTDGGTRIQQNVRSTFSRGFVAYVNPCREWLNFGPDSRGSVSIYVGSVTDACTPIPHDGAQDFVFKTDELTRKSQIIFTRPNWNLQYIFSTTLHAGDRTVNVNPLP